MRSILSSTGGQNRGRSERRYRTDSVSLGNRIEESDAGRASATFGPIDGPATWNSKWIAQLCSSRWVAWCESTESRAAVGGCGGAWGPDPCPPAGAADLRLPTFGPLPVRRPTG